MVEELLARLGKTDRKQDLELLFMVLSHCETVEDFQLSGIPIIENWVGSKKSRAQREMIDVLQRIYQTKSVEARHDYLGQVFEWLVWRAVYLNRAALFPADKGRGKVYREAQILDGVTDEIVDIRQLKPGETAKSYDVVIARVNHEDCLLAGWGLEAKFDIAHQRGDKQLADKLLYMNHISSLVGCLYSWIITARTFYWDFEEYCVSLRIEGVRVKTYEELWSR